jgi:hypothetical protein
MLFSESRGALNSAEERAQDSAQLVTEMTLIISSPRHPVLLPTHILTLQN